MLKRLRRWWRREDGVTAVEFALVAVPMFTMIMGILEMSLYFASGNILEGAAQEGGRRIRTGQVQAAEDPELAFKNFVCDSVGIMMDCTKINYQVIHVADDSFSTAENTEPEYDENGDLVPQPFDAGNSSDVILIRAHYKWEFLTPFVGALLAGSLSQNYASHLTTVVLKTEPYCTSIIQENC